MSPRTIEVAGPAEKALAAAADLRREGWDVTVSGSRLSPCCDIVWSLSISQ